MSCRSSLSFIVTALGKQYSDDGVSRRLRVAGGYHGHHPLVRLGWLQVGELAAEQILGEEVAVPGGQPPDQHLAVRGQEDHPRLRPAVKQQVTVGSPER